MHMLYSNTVIEELFNAFKSLFGIDHDKYRNHVYRVFLACVAIDNKLVNEDKYAYAAFFHDIGIWSDNTIDYLDPSIDQAYKYLTENGKQDLVADVTLMIYWHHKIRPYKNYHAEMVEVFRKADWIDVSLGLVNFGFSRKKIRNGRQSFPNLGFHRFLVMKILKNLFIHPLNPLPMFKS
jgi:hypothetical protein